MEPETPPKTTAKPESEEKLPWSKPELKKLDIKETAISIGQTSDADGFS